jgi:hypothetical protein
LYLILAHSAPSFIVASHNVQPELKTCMLHFCAYTETLGDIIELIAREFKLAFYERH